LPDQPVHVEATPFKLRQRGRHFHLTSFQGGHQQGDLRQQLLSAPFIVHLVPARFFPFAGLAGVASGADAPDNKGRE
jgi:hypothetical protein